MVLLTYYLRSTTEATIITKQMLGLKIANSCAALVVLRGAIFIITLVIPKCRVVNVKHMSSYCREYLDLNTYVAWFGICEYINCPFSNMTIRF